MGIDFFELMKPEVSLMLIICLLLVMKIWDGVKETGTLLVIANLFLVAHFILGFFMNKEGALFSGMYHTNAIIVLEKNILAFGTLLISLLAWDWLKKHQHLLEFYILLLSTLLGLNFMISSGNFLMLYLGLELATIPLAALCNFDLDKTKSSEAALKLIMSSAFASGVLLFGISMLYGTTGAISFDEIAAHLDGNALQMISLIFVFCGFAFKLSVVPFHFWTADVYEGSPVAVTSYLSVISKGAVVFVFINALSPLFREMHEAWEHLLLVAIVLTITVGNLFAIRQDNLKRFLAFSSITQIGYILLGLTEGGSLGSSAAIYFLVVYIFSNLAAFGVVGMIVSQTGKENISEMNGFYKNNGILGWAMALAVFSLAGIPPTAGFFGKMFLVMAGASKGNYYLIAFAALNMVVSLYYYLRIVKAIFMNKAEQPMEKIKGSPAPTFALVICIAGIVAVGFYSGIYDYIFSLFTK
ncbi:MAG: NADH-quinone oxidoreductase subunit N [Bacteroidetes bacterium]|nr:NADH-quinone oxidoreductase subunit N [Bacteroidota bacterium]